jgi:hypothetical protein
MTSEDREREPEAGGMGTTGTPGEAGASAVLDPDRRVGAAEGAPSPGTGGAVDDPLLPFDRRPDEEAGPVHRAPGYSTGDADR